MLSPALTKLKDGWRRTHGYTHITPQPTLPTGLYRPLPPKQPSKIFTTAANRRQQGPKPGMLYTSIKQEWPQSLQAGLPKLVREQHWTCPNGPYSTVGFPNSSTWFSYRIYSIHNAKNGRHVARVSFLCVSLPTVFIWGEKNMEELQAHLDITEGSLTSEHPSNPSLQF